MSVSDGNDRDWLCEIASVNDEEVILTVLPDEREDTELPVSVSLFQGIPKGDKTETILQKCVELGLAEYVPVAMKRCVVKIDEKKKDARRER